jgi:hypothetical protein
MGQWKKIDSPKLRIPLEFREVTEAGSKERVWEVQELRMGSMFKVTLGEEALEGHRRRPPTDAETERAVCLAIEEAMISPPDKEHGMTYEVQVRSDELAEAVETSG